MVEKWSNIQLLPVRMCHKKIENKIGAIINFTPSQWWHQGGIRGHPPHWRLCPPLSPSQKGGKTTTTTTISHFLHFFFFKFIFAPSDMHFHPWCPYKKFLGLPLLPLWLNWFNPWGYSDLVWSGCSSGNSNYLGVIFPKIGTHLKGFCHKNTNFSKSKPKKILKNRPFARDL